ncbi:LpqB family beta-propeller domain-containing protein [Aeromicrobium sp.]|uniref:LpqB family beta-propeller domain-containing protein n=1 Tax=Aeromicrobium sp. TaxID=1871063 RepID=UPI003D6A1BDC
MTATVLAGCAGIPTSGPVERVADERGPDQSTVRYEPVGPSRGASPQQIVRGYLDAMLAYPVSTGTAASYLTPDAAEEWQSSAGVTVYTRPEVTLPESEFRSGRGDVTVGLRTNAVAQLDRQGHFTRASGVTERSYRLEEVEGEWRIANPQNGVMVTRTYYDAYFRSFSLYFFDAAGKRLVSDLVHLAVGEQLPTGLVTSLARGPDRTPGTLRTYVPGVGDLRPSVTISDDDVADVEFSVSLAGLSGQEKDRLGAQIVWTLRSVPNLQGVRITGETSILSSRGERVHPIDSWGGFGPPVGDDRTYALVDDKLVEIDGSTIRSFSGPWGRDAGGAVEAAVSDDGVAAVMGGRDQVRVTDRDGREPFLVQGSGFIAPEWDHDDRLWLIDRPSGSTRVRVVDDGRTRTLSAAGLRGVSVRSVAISPDDGWYAATARAGGRTSVYVGPVERDRDDRLTGLGSPRRLSIRVDDPRSVGWVSSTRVAFLGASEAGMQLYDVALDGTDRMGGGTGSGPLLPDVGATTLAGRANDDPSRWVVDARGRLWYLPPDGSWRLIDERSFSGLSTGD